MQESDTVNCLAGTSQQPQLIDPYKNSFIIQKLKKTKQKKIAFLDLDGTLAAGKPERVNEARKNLESLGYSIVFVSTRTEECLMTEDEYQKTVDLCKFGRPKPRMSNKDGKRFYVPPEDHEPIGLLNPDVIAGSTGTQILVRQIDGGYLLDKSFEEGFNQDSEAWRSTTLDVLDFLDPNHTLGILMSIEDPNRYLKFSTDVFPPNFRIGMLFPTLIQKITFLNAVKKARHSIETPDHIKEQLKNIRVTDDSHPKNDKYAIYITPLKGYKARSVEKIVDSICKSLKAERNALELLIAGDSYPDLEMGLVGGLGTKATFLLVGGSRLSTVMCEAEEDEFAGEAMFAIKQRLFEKELLGHYRFNIPMYSERDVIVGDEAYTGKTGVESILSYLQTPHAVLLDADRVN